jgi:hypothetical protein
MRILIDFLVFLINLPLMIFISVMLLIAYGLCFITNADLDGLPTPIEQLKKMWSID